MCLLLVGWVWRWWTLAALPSGLSLALCLCSVTAVMTQGLEVSEFVLSALCSADDVVGVEIALTLSALIPTALAYPLVALEALLL